MNLRMSCKSWWAWRRHELERAVARLKHRNLFRTSRALGELAYSLQRALVSHDARHSEACAARIEESRRPKRDYDVLAQKHRPKTAEALCREVHRLSRAGLNPLDISTALRLEMRSARTPRARAAHG
jgi:hypothetical protein